MARHARWSNTISNRLGFDLYSGNEKETLGRQVKSKESPRPFSIAESMKTNRVLEEPKITTQSNEDNVPSIEPEVAIEARSEAASSIASQHSSYLSRIDGAGDRNTASTTVKKGALRKKLKNKFVRKLPKSEPVADEELTGARRHEADSKYVSDWMLKMDEVRDAIKNKTEQQKPKEVSSEEKFEQLDFNFDDESEIVRTSEEIVSKIQEDGRNLYSGLLSKAKHIEETALKDFDDGSVQESDYSVPMKVDSWFPGRKMRKIRKKPKKPKAYDLENDDVDEQFQTIRMAIKLDEPRIEHTSVPPKTRKHVAKKKGKNEFTSSVSASQNSNTNGHFHNNQKISKKSTIPIEVLRPDILSSWNEPYSQTNYI